MRHGPDWPLDEDFLAALAHGMPPSAGIALGFDRLAMIASGADRIGQVLWLPPADLAMRSAHRREHADACVWVLIFMAGLLAGCVNGLASRQAELSQWVGQAGNRAGRQPWARQTGPMTAAA